LIDQSGLYLHSFSRINAMVIFIVSIIGDDDDDDDDDDRNDEDNDDPLNKWHF